MVKLSLPTYTVDWQVSERPPAVHEVIAASQALLDVVRPRLRWAVIDAYTDHQESELTGDAAATRESLLARGSKGMGVRLDLDQAHDWQALYVFGAHSINADLMDARLHYFGCLHDSGDAIWAELDEAEAGELRERIIHLAPLINLDEYHERERLAKEAARSRRSQERRARLARVRDRWLGRG